MFNQNNNNNDVSSQADSFNTFISFSYKSQRVRVIKDENGEPWFVAKDVL